MATNGNGKGKRKRSYDDGNKKMAGGSQIGQPHALKQARFLSPRGNQASQKQPDSVAFDLPLEISVLKFAHNRSRELDALSKAVENDGGTKLSFQRLPKHMRRHAMSHDIRRIPRRLRLKAQAEMEKREAATPSKRPSRRHRRRPSNLLSEYQRRQRRNAWLETHIWHAKRFRMTTAWGYRLPVHPCDKSLRACYRATTHHCLLQDVSFECCIEVGGDQEAILKALSHICSTETGLTFAAKTTALGRRWGKVMLYACDAYPHGAVAPVTFVWQPEGVSSTDEDITKKQVEKQNRKLWIWCHPASFSAVWTLLTKALTLVCPTSTDDIPEQAGQGSQDVNGEGLSPVDQAPKLEASSQAHEGKDIGSKASSGAQEEKVDSSGLPSSSTSFSIGQLQLRSLKDQLIKFRLTGPASNLILKETLKLADIKYVSPEEKLDDSLSCTANVKSAPMQTNLPSQAGDGRENTDNSLSLQTKLTETSGDATGPSSKPWWQTYYTCAKRRRQFEAQEGVWGRLGRCQSPDEAPPQAVLGLTVRDPRVLLPSALTKVARHQAESSAEVLTWDEFPPMCADSALWSEAVRSGVTKTKLTEQEMNRRRSKLLVPGSTLQLGDEESRVPVLLLQRPGSQPASRHKRSTLRGGVASGWDVVAPKGWGMAFWIAMVYRGARVGGLREASSLATRSGQQSFPRDFPDCTAGVLHQQESRDEALDKYVRRPPAKRVNFQRLGVPAPFHCPFSQLVSEWQQTASGATDKLRVLRCRRLLRGLQECVEDVDGKRSKAVGGGKKNASSNRLSTFLSKGQQSDLMSKHLHSVVPVSVACLLRGVPAQRAMICLPSAADLQLLAKDPGYFGPVESLHKKSTQPGKKKKGKGVSPNQPKDLQATSANLGSKDGKKRFLSAKQREEKAQLLKEPTKIVEACDRPIFGFLTGGDFDLGQGRGSGVGFCSLMGLLTSLEGADLSKPFLVLLRNPSSRQYRFAHISVLF